MKKERLEEVTMKCVWCNKKAPNLKEIRISVVGRFGVGKHDTTMNVCSNYCEKKLRGFVEYANKYALLFICSIFGALLVMIASSVLRIPMVIPIAVCMLGILVIIFPFATPETVGIIGVKKSITIIRVLGFMVFFMGAFIFWLFMQI